MPRSSVQNNPEKRTFTKDVQSSSVLLRQECLCEATKHPLINNCINCGRIICEREGSGPCFTCCNLVCTNEEREILNKSTKSSDMLYQKLLGGGNLSFKNIRTVLCSDDSPDLKTAVAHKNKLIDFNRTVERRTRVMDDEGDYFDPETNKWLTASQRERLLKKIESEAIPQHHHRATKLTFDFSGRCVVEETVEQQSVDLDEILQDDTSIFEFPGFTQCSEIGNYKLQYVDTDPLVKYKKPSSDKMERLRVQDKELQYMSDDGLCLSIHQPYASLIIAGIKKHEGRSWYTPVRGRLWIRSGVKIPSNAEIQEVENFYHEITGVTEFPQNYCYGCVLGCVDLTDCLPQESYREKFREGEVGSEYVFIFENPRALKVQFPMPGQKKIFKMDYKFHEAAKKTLRKL